MESNFSTTVKSYKAALRELVRLAFDLDLQDDEFYKIIRSLLLCRPAPSPGRLSWSLENVLSNLAQVDPEQSSIKDLLDKTIFLIALASGGRISEISALRRGPEFTYVSSTDFLILSPGPDFLAKNEDPSNRRKPWRISPISGDDSSLCPVATTQAYLRCTADFAAGSLLGIMCQVNLFPYWAPDVISHL